MTTMFSAIRRRLHVSPATAIATLALVFAMTGGAYAAKKYLITSTKQISPSVLKSLQGKAGPAGAQGPGGPAGPQGPAGAKGENGTAGANGTNGTNGTSVTSAVLAPKSANCKEGGSEFKAASGVTFACNGEKGKNGTFEGQSLPAGKTLKGTWAGAGFAEGQFTGGAKAGVSFPLVVSPAPEAQEVGLGEGENEEETKWAPAIKEGKCKGDSEEPAAAEGQLCIFATNLINTSDNKVFTSVKGSLESSVGFVVSGISAAKGFVGMEGTWAVTGG